MLHATTPPIYLPLSMNPIRAQLEQIDAEQDLLPRLLLVPHGRRNPSRNPPVCFLRRFRSKCSDPIFTNIFAFVVLVKAFMLLEGHTREVSGIRPTPGLVSHVLKRFQLPTRHPQQGTQDTNLYSSIDSLLS